MNSWRKKRYLTGMLIAFLMAIVCCIAFQFNLFYGMQLRSTDFLFRTTSNQAVIPQENEIVIVAIDDKSLDQLGHFLTWPRTYYADIIDRLSQNNARVIAFDILFSEKTPYDEKLAVSMKNAGNVIMPVVKVSSTPSSIITTTQNDYLYPIADFSENAVALGHTNFNPDTDGIVRKLPLLLADGDNYQPSLALAAVAEYLRLNTVIESDIQGTYLPFAGRSIPIDESNATIINYMNCSGSEGYIPFQTVSFSDLLENEVDCSMVNDRIVLIGATATGLGDTFWTPSGKMLNGVEIHAHAINSILTSNFIRTANSLSVILLIMVLAMLCGYLVLRFRLLWASLMTLALLAIYFVSVSIYFDEGIMLNNFYPPVAILGTFVTTNLFNVTTEQSQKKRITRTFGQYVSAPIVAKIVDALEKGDLELGGTEQEVSVAFADIRGFTGIAEKMRPGDLVSALNMYLSIVIQAVTDNQGVINKFGGDSILAIWNTPTECKEHSLMATKAGIEAQNRIKKLQLENPHLPKMDFGIGINTGVAVVGNMGSQDRFEYSVIGDTVNIASRITSAAKGGKVWISEATFHRIENHVKVKSLDELSVKGREGTVKTYEVLELVTESDKLFSIKQSSKTHHTFTLKANNVKGDI
jgi:adenylate cyclase